MGALAVLLGSRPAQAQSEIRTVPGASGVRLGAALAEAGDVNGDGYPDFLAGMPGFNGGRGGVVCLSGRYLRTGAPPASIYTVPAPLAAGADAAFGTSIAAMGDLTGDGVIDFAIGAPFADVFAVNGGAVYWLNGATRALQGTPFGALVANAHAGWSISRMRDLESDGKDDLLVGAPGIAEIAMTSSTWMTTGSGITTISWPADAAWGSGSQFGYAVFGMADVNGDGLRDVIATAPYADGTLGLDQGVVRVLSGAVPTGPIATYFGLPGQRLGRALDAGMDLDGDGASELVVGAFNRDNGGQGGSASVLSGARLVQNLAPIAKWSWNGAANISGVSWQFGASVDLAPDLSGDGTPDVLIGAPTFASGNIQRGAVWVFSGSTGSGVGWISGTTSERIGSAVLGVDADLNGDGGRDFLVGASDADNPNVDGGLVRAVTPYPSGPWSYCTAKVNSLGCTPTCNWSGVASATSPAAFTVGAANLLNQKNGYLFYGFAPNAAPFQGGVLCVAPPTLRTPLQSSGGSAAGADCTGAFALDFNQRIRSGVDPALVVGEEVYCQHWSRDPASPSTTSLTNAVGFLINP